MNDNPATERLDAGAAALADALRVTFRLLRLFLLLAIAGYVASGIFVVSQSERAIVLLFGRPVGVGAEVIKEPGLHWTWPRPFTEIIRVPTERVQTIHTRRFWHSVETEIEGHLRQWPASDPEIGYAITGDANILHSRWAVRFTVSDPFQFVFGHADPAETVRDELERAVMMVSAKYSIDEAMRGDVAGLRAAVEAKVRERVRELDLGVRIQGVDVLAVAPPPETASAFNDVIQAAQERDQAMNDARAEATRIRNEALGEADRISALAVAERQRRVAATAARADAFTSLQEAWSKNPALVRETLRQDALRTALSAAGRKVILTGSGSDQEIRINFGSPPRGILDAQVP